MITILFLLFLYWRRLMQSFKFFAVHKHAFEKKITHDINLMTWIWWKLNWNVSKKIPNKYCSQTMKHRCSKHKYMQCETARTNTCRLCILSGNNIDAAGESESTEGDKCTCYYMMAEWKPQKWYESCRHRCMCVCGCRNFCYGQQYM